ncbi:hypothetical protein AcdelDRAFT_3718 [Acidovorax delafieldii 2AN]|jgi:hypothetical protein|uniref:Uncharacterized protein n=1 Tax=Acidovorax delafieldii 2AN TaxID=573060 RepID=C5T9Y8_ACIDE|nr:hypothetical protein [Acidovorax delafieldii]EER58716.1 hypothetical protein AcdelDRAFT_3718 [Acidovorax delafieldii 2AN]
MEAIQVIAPLIGVVLGSVLSGIGAHIRARREHKRIVGSALADLLEVRHRIVGFDLVLEKIQSMAGLEPNALAQVRNLMDTAFPSDPMLEERYAQAVTQLAGVDPVLAFNLRSKNALPKVLSILRAQAASAGANLGMFESFESQLLRAARPSIDAAVLELGKSHSILTGLKVRRLVRKSDKLPEDVSQFFDKLAGSIPAISAGGRSAV